MMTANDYQWCFRVLDDNQFDIEFYGPMSKSEANNMFRAYESNGAYGLGFGFKTNAIGRGDIARAYRNKRLKELQGEHRARALKCVGMDTKIFSSEMVQIFMDKYLTVLEKGAQDAKSDGVKDLLNNMIRACKTAKLKTTTNGSGYHIVFPLGTEMKIMAKEFLVIDASGGEKEHHAALLLNADPEKIRENQLIWSKEVFDLYLYAGKAEAAKVRAAKRQKTASTMPEELKIALSQLTGSSNPLRSLAVMVGAKNFMYSDKDENMYVQFNHMLGRSRRLPKSVGKTRLRYDIGRDTYTLTFLTSRGNVLAEVDDIHAAELGEVWEEYTGLYLSFNAIRKSAY